MITTTPAATWSCAWLFRRCFRWGLVAGAAAGAAAGVNAACLVLIAAHSDAGGLLVLAAGNAGALPVLWWARASIVKRWAGAPAV